MRMKWVPIIGGTRCPSVSNLMQVGDDNNGSHQNMMEVEMVVALPLRSTLMTPNVFQFIRSRTQSRIQKGQSVVARQKS